MVDKQAQLDGDSVFMIQYDEKVILKEFNLESRSLGDAIFEQSEDDKTCKFEPNQLEIDAKQEFAFFTSYGDDEDDES